MSKILSIVLFAGCLGLTVADAWNQTEGACTIYESVLIKSLQTKRFFNVRRNKVEVNGVRKEAFNRKWILEAGLGWFVIRNAQDGWGSKLLGVKGGCENAKPRTKLTLEYRKTAQDDNKFVINSDGTIQSLCSEDLYLKATPGRLLGDIVLANVGDPFTSKEDIRFTIKRGL